MMQKPYTPLTNENNHWNRLINEVRNGQLVPVVGTELLTMEIDGQTQPFYRYVAHQIADTMGIEVPDDRELNSLSDLADLYRIQQHGDPEDISHEAQEVVHSRDWPTPEPLIRLAEITDLKFILTTTPDNLMAQALRDVRQGVAASAQVLAYAPHTVLRDLPDAYDPCCSDQPLVYKLFGDVSMTPNYVLTEEDILRFVHHLQMRDERPANLFDILKQRSLAMLGCSFNNWLVRFFFCLAKGDVLFGRQGAKGVVADTKTREDLDLLPFLGRNKTLLYEAGDGTDFVNELHRRWTEKTGAVPTAAAAADEPETEPAMMAEDAVFISYASEDREAAVRIQTQLRQRGIFAWLDKDQLEGGDVFEFKIRDRIRDCYVFLPVISKSTITSAPRYFRREWNQALQEVGKWPEDYPFIQPVVIDDTPMNAPNVPDGFRRRHWSRCPGGTLDEHFIKPLGRLIKRQQQ